jgi:hypothetical protein
VHSQCGMPDKRCFLSRREKPDADVVICRGGRQHECCITIVQFSRDGLHFGIGKQLRIQHHTGGVAAESRVGECIDLGDPNVA